MSPRQWQCSLCCFCIAGKLHIVIEVAMSSSHCLHEHSNNQITQHSSADLRCTHSCLGIWSLCWWGPHQWSGQTKTPRGQFMPRPPLSAEADSLALSFGDHAISNCPAGVTTVCDTMCCSCIFLACTDLLKQQPS